MSQPTLNEFERTILRRLEDAYRRKTYNMQVADGEAFGIDKQTRRNALATAASQGERIDELGTILLTLPKLDEEAWRAQWRGRDAGMQQWNEHLIARAEAA